MGGNSSSMGDAFYPDNPKRRARAQQLKNQTQDIGAGFNMLKTTRDQSITNLGSKIDSLIQAMGCSNSTDLENKARNALKPDQLAKYNSLKQRLNLDDKAQAIGWDLVSIESVTSGMFIDPGNAFQTASDAAMAVLSSSAAGPVAMAETLGISALTDGNFERTLLQTITIPNLFHYRGLARMYYEQMRTTTNYFADLETALNSSEPAQSQQLNYLLNMNLDTAIASWGIQRAYAALKVQDNDYGAWTTDDPQPNVFGIYTGDMAIVPPPPSTAGATVNASQGKSFAMPASMPAPQVDKTESGAQHVSATQPNNLSHETGKTEQGAQHAPVTQHPTTPSPPPTAQVMVDLNGQEKQISLTLEKPLTIDSAVVRYSGQLYKLTATHPQQPEQHAKGAVPPGSSPVDLQHTVFSLTPWKAEDGSTSAAKSDHATPSVANAAADGALQHGFKIKSWQSSHA